MSTNRANHIEHPARTLFRGGYGYLSAATAGLPTKETAEATNAHLSEWERGALNPAKLDEQFEACRSHFAALAKVSPTQVAIGSQVSQLVSVIATALAPGSEVLCADGDFASLVHPFVQCPELNVRTVKFEDLAAEINSNTALVAFSLVQSATGAVADFERITRAAESHDARTLVDLTQSLGWLDVGAEGFDYTVTHSYKWLCSPRGMAFLTVRGRSDALRPTGAGWYSADDVWSSCYANHMPLSATAAKFDLSPVWPAIAGTEAALRMFTTLDRTEVQTHAVTLANEARAILRLPPSNSAIVTWPDPEGADLAAMQRAGIVAAGRAGNARISFHLWNTSDDIALLRNALRDGS